MSNASEMGKLRVVAIANQKGGVGKTTTAISLAAVLSTERRVLLIDLDPQGNASTGLGRFPGTSRLGTYELLLEQRPLATLLTPTNLPNLSLLSSHPDLAGAELELATTPQRDLRLQEALSADWVTEHLDYILIDCPPSLGLLTINALVAADSLIIPLQCEFFALDGLRQITSTLKRIQQRLNPNITLEGIVLTMFDRRNSLSEQVAADVRANFPSFVYDTVIPRNVRIGEAPSHGLPITLYDVRSAGAQAYIEFTAEFLRRERARTSSK